MIKNRLLLTIFLTSLLISLTSCVFLQPNHKKDGRLNDGSSKENCGASNIGSLGTSSSQNLDYKSDNEIELEINLALTSNEHSSREFEAFIFVNEVYVENSPIFSVECGNSKQVTIPIDLSIYLPKSQFSGVAITSLISPRRQIPTDKSELEEVIYSNRPDIYYPYNSSPIPHAQVFEQNINNQNELNVTYVQKNDLMAIVDGKNILNISEIVGLSSTETTAYTSFDAYSQQNGQPIHMAKPMSSDSVLHLYIGGYPQNEFGVVCIQDRKQLLLKNGNQKTYILTSNPNAKDDTSSIFFDIHTTLNLDFENLSRVDCYALTSIFREEGTYEMFDDVGDDPIVGIALYNQ